MSIPIDPLEGIVFVSQTLERMERLIDPLNVVEPIIIVEPMRKSDIPAVMAIEKQCYPCPWQETAYYTELNNRSAVYLVARRDLKVAGFGGMWVVMDEAHITTLAVEPVHRQQKIGERLLNDLLCAAVNIGASHATLEVRESNVAAQNLYEKYGFTQAAIRRNYYADNQENAIVMWADGLRDPKFALGLYDRRLIMDSQFE
ncbi:MAG: ribosomal protein S18-alanine N-acetyltransferase [Chthonomonadales bacterium]